MRTSKQIEEKLEKITEELTKQADAISKLDKPEDASTEEQIQLAATLSSVGILAWVLEMEEILKPLFLAAKFKGIADQLSGKDNK